MPPVATGLECVGKCVGVWGEVRRDVGKVKGNVGCVKKHEGVWESVWDKCGEVC